MVYITASEYKHLCCFGNNQVYRHIAVEQHILAYILVCKLLVGSHHRSRLVDIDYETRYVDIVQRLRR